MKDPKTLLFTLGVAILFVIGCNVPDPMKKESEQAQLASDGITVRTIDSCEYIVGQSSNGFGTSGICHKQNCKFCAERKRYESK